MYTFQKELKIALIAVIVIVMAVASMGIFGGFGAQCRRAGFSGAEQEACVIRAKKYGVIYKENIPKSDYERN